LRVAVFLDAPTGPFAEFLYKAEEIQRAEFECVPQASVRGERFNVRVGGHLAEGRGDLQLGWADGLVIAMLGQLGLARAGVVAQLRGQAVPQRGQRRADCDRDRGG
jgi:hypothetical protein